MSLPTGLTAALRRLLSDGEPHTLGYLHANARHLILPESAVRKFQRQAHSPDRLPMEQQVAQGERLVIYHALRAMRASQLDPAAEGWQTRFRLVETESLKRVCRTCHQAFMPRNPNERYCQIECLRAATRAQIRRYRERREGVRPLPTARTPRSAADG
jgi:hypothetical protein